MPIPSIAPRPDGAPPSGPGTSQGAHRVVQVLVGLLALALAMLAVLLFVAGVHHNEQIDELRNHGIQVEATVTGCLGALGGSGSNAAGATCTGSYRVNGRRYSGPLPGSQLRSPGTVVAIVTTRSDPGLVESPSVVATERSSDGVYVLPSVFAALWLALIAVVGVRWRSERAPTAAD